MEPGAGATGGSAGADAGPADAAGTGGTTLLPDVVIDSASDTFMVDPDAACEKTTDEARFVPANVLFVIDKSGSMSCNPPPEQSSASCDASPVPVNASSPTKWALTRDALKAAIGGMPSSSSVGVAYFPRGSVCERPIQPDVPIASLTAGHRAKLDESLDGVTPVGATPLAGSLSNGYIYLGTESLTGNVFVILITDGAESCGGDTTQLVGTVASEAAKGVRTFVIGAPGSESFRSVLSDIAFAGETASSSTCAHGGSQPDMGDCHYDMTSAGDFSAALNAALATISGTALSCEFLIPDRLPNGDPIDYGKVNVRYRPGTGDPETLIRFAPSGDCDGDGGTDGWQYSADRASIVLCGASCETVKGDATAKVSIVFGCDSVK